MKIPHTDHTTNKEVTESDDQLYLDELNITNWITLITCNHCR